METYKDFAGVYDIFMDDAPYEQWADFAADVIERYGISRPAQNREMDTAAADGEMSGMRQEEILRSERDLVVELGCGTGTLTELLY